MPTIFEYIDLIRENNLSHGDISFLYNKCYKIALVTLSKKYSDGNHIFLNTESTFENIATDAIAPLFTSSKPDEQIGFNKSLALWDTAIKNESHADYFIHKVVWNRVSQHVTKLLKETDPYFKKILALLKYHIRVNGLHRITYFGIIYITESKNSRIESTVIPSEDFENFPNHLFINKYDLIFSNLFKYIETETDYFAAIPLNALIRKFKKISGSDLVGQVSDSVHPFFEESIDIENIVQSSLIRIYSVIDQNHAINSKNDKIVIDAYKLVLKDIANDFKNGGISRGLYDYLHFYLKDLTKEKFYGENHSQLNYLMNQFKKLIAEKINL